jgi:hypothetical protein
VQDSAARALWLLVEGDGESGARVLAQESINCDPMALAQGLMRFCREADSQEVGAVAWSTH